MYYRESDSIANETPDLSDRIKMLDEHLFLNQDAVVRIDSTADMLNIDPDDLRNLLELYVEKGVVKAVNLPICPKCDIAIEDTSGTPTCDICDTKFQPKQLTAETVFVSRKTEFECGDDFSTTIETSYEVDGLFKIAGCSNESRTVDVIFVHGLEGDAKQTWHPENQPSKYWPQWISEKLPDVGVWSLDYEAAKIKWSGDALPLSDRAKDILGRLVLAGLGTKPIVFVTHSLGGLVVKQLLRHAREMGVEDWKKIGESISGIMFIATPHSGSDLSGYLSMISAIARPTAAVADLAAHHPRLRELNEWFRNNFVAMRLTATVLYETKLTKSFMVVNETSADPGVAGVSPLPIEADHIQICKPLTKTSPVFLHTVKLIEKVAKMSPKP